MNINKYISIPYRNLGRDFDGCDCYGLIRLVLREEYGKQLPLLTKYEDANDNNASLFDEQVPLLSGKEKESPEIGDVGVFRFKGVPSHLGIYIGGGRILHVMHGSHSVCEKINSPRLKGKLDGWYEIR